MNNDISRGPDGGGAREEGRNKAGNKQGIGKGCAVQGFLDYHAHSSPILRP